MILVSMSLLLLNPIYFIPRFLSLYKTPARIRWPPNRAASSMLCAVVILPLVLDSLFIWNVRLTASQVFSAGKTLSSAKLHTKLECCVIPVALYLKYFLKIESFCPEFIYQVVSILNSTRNWCLNQWFSNCRSQSTHTVWASLESQPAYF